MRLALIAMSLACALPLAGCGGTKLVRRPAEVPQLTQALASAAEGTVSARVDFVIVRNGPGAWAKNGDWDEYLLRARNTGHAPLRIIAIDVTDGQGTHLQPLGGRKALVQASKQAARRFRAAGIKVEAGRGGSTLVATGVGAGVVGYGAASAAAANAALGAGGSVGGGAATAAGGLLLAAPVLVGMGIARMVNNSKVDQRIGARATPLPLELAPDREQPLDLFFPISPGPRELTLHYQDDAGDHALIIDTRASLGQLHLVPSPGHDARGR